MAQESIGRPDSETTPRRHTPIGSAYPGQRVAVYVDARRVVGGIYNAQVVVFAQKCLPVLCANLDVVDALGVGEVGVNGCIQESAVLGNG